MSAGRSERWSDWRYRRFLPWAAASHARGRAYAQLVGVIELVRDRERRGVAVDRIRRWLRANPAAAHRIFLQSLASEAREEADSVFFMRYPGALATAFRPPAAAAALPLQATIYVTLHFGSPVLAYLYLARLRGLDVGLIGRQLDASNPMTAGKRRYAVAKVAWVEQLTGRPFLGVDAASMVRARAALLDGQSLFAAIDVPADVVARSEVLELFGEPVRLSAGIFILARLTGARVQPIVAMSRGGALEVRYGRPVAPTQAAPQVAAVAAEITDLVRRFPGEWWLWPYVTPAGAARGGTSLSR